MLNKVYKYISISVVGTQFDSYIYISLNLEDDGVIRTKDTNKIQHKVAVIWCEKVDLVCTLLLLSEAVVKFLCGTA